MRRKLPLLASLVGLPLLGLAQTGSDSPRFYAGAGANLLTDVPFNSAGVPNLVGPSLTAGGQLTPHLAVQASAAYHWKNTSYTAASYSSSMGSSFTSTYRYKYLTVPVLLRYTFSKPEARFHFDGLGGLTLLYGSFHYTSSDPYSSSYYYYPNDYSTSSTKANATLGPAVRYTLSPRVELSASGLVSAILGDSYYRFSDRLFLNVLVGAHYTFGQL